MSMKIRFLGTNGWFSTPATGSTTCAAIILQGRLIVLDAGEGLHKVPALAKEEGARKIDIFISHLHLDHIIGLHTLPLFKEGVEVRIFVHKGYVKSLKAFLNHPYTAGAKELWADVKVMALKEGENRLPYKVIALPLKHADPSWGFRFEIDGKKAAYCADTGPCGNLVRLAKGTDALVTECALPPGAPELSSWPHLSPEMAAKAAKKANTSMLLLTHFDAMQYQTLAAREKAAKCARRIFKPTTAATDGLEVRV